ncbi:unnamed protein product [Mytilus edulis]|uniref:Uncharacterized protein n=1 Tax=Mytilus edulis TaxID=6550 RepID=A0A8S3V5T1_MYTED|nr:unnamed protein product [Mytilus edulis]
MATVKQDSSPIRPPNFRIEIPGDEKVSPATTKPVGGNGVLFQEISLKNSTGKATVAVWDSLVDTIQKGKVINISKCRGCENRILFAQNVRSTVTCLECDKPRCVYSKLKLTPRDVRALKHTIDKYDYTCGAILAPEATAKMSQAEGHAFSDKLQSFSESRDDYDKSLDKNIQLVKQLLSDFDECFDQVHASNKPSPQRSSSVQASPDRSLPLQQSFCIGSPVPQQPSVSTDSVTLASTATQQRQSKELEAKRIRLKCLETEIEIRKQTAELEALLELKSAQSDYLLSLDDHDQTLVKQIDSDERFRSDTKTDSNNNNHVTFSSSTPHGQAS